MDFLLNGNVGAAAMIVVAISLALRLAFKEWWGPKVSGITALFLSLVVMQLLVIKELGIYAGTGLVEPMLYGVLHGFVCFIVTVYAHEKLEAAIEANVKAKFGLDK